MAETFIAYPMLLIGYTSFVATGIIPTGLWAPVAIALMGLAVIGILVIYVYARDRAQLGAAGLDERQRQLATKAWAVSYGVLATVVAIGAGGAALYLSFEG
ncbi:MAG TPA: hypothetical protein VJZ72_07325, partial [Candidatus Limnocylindrales bacterium]|nr:hypothetical protein [Candidatus Limnocylindrales bacterium]